MTASTSLRQRKKDLTRAALLKASHRLFNKQGYEATTLEQISDSANVSRPTLLAYFQTKDRLALAVTYDQQERFREEVCSNDRTASTLTIWRTHVLDESLPAFMARPQNHRAFLRDLSVALARGRIELLQGYEDILASGLAADYETDSADLSTRMQATMLVYGLNTILQQWFADGCRQDVQVQVRAVIDFVEEQFPKPGTPFRQHD